MAGMNIADLAGAMVPFEVNSVAVGADGHLTRSDPRERPFGFRFSCLGLRFAASTGYRGGHPWLQVSARVGPLPYTAESQERRQRALTILRASLGLRHGRIELSRDRQIEISAALPLADRLTAVRVVGAATELLLELKPLVELLNEFVLIGPPCALSRDGAAA